jgi:hypothetical protein
MINENGITVKELKDFIKDWPEVDSDGEPYEIWFCSGHNGHNLSSICTGVCRLNEGDILIGRWDE